MNTVYETEETTLKGKLVSIIRDNLNNNENVYLLKRLDKIIKWDDFTEIVTRYLPEASGGTYKNNKVLTLIKCLILENIFNFSDYKLFIELADKDPFQNFVGIDSTNKIPKVKIISSFRSNLMINNIYEMIIEKFNEQLIEEKTEILDYSPRDEEKDQNNINANDIETETLYETKIIEIEERVRKLYEKKLSSILTGMSNETANDVKDKLLRVKSQIEKLSGEKIDISSENYQKMLNVENSIINISGIAEKLENDENSTTENNESDLDETEKLYNKIINSFFISLEDNETKNENNKTVNDFESGNIIQDKLKYADKIILELKDSLKNLDEISSSQENPEPEKLIDSDDIAEPTDEKIEIIETNDSLILSEPLIEQINEIETNSPHPSVIYPSKKTEGIFNDENLTEDYELGFRFHQLGLKMGFFNVMLDSHNEATRISTAEFFPNKFWPSVKQRSRWIAGICLQNWKAHKWKGDLTAKYFMFRDRKPLFSILGAFLSNVIIFYILFAIVCHIFKIANVDFVMNSSSVLWYLVVANLFFMISRTVHRFAYTYNWYGFRFGLFSIVRLVIDTFINFFAVLRSLKVYRQTKKKVVWDSTTHY